ncbi:MAG TPA: restriction endonuclease subunit S [Thermoanaerobaculia bacterium]|nr:restriction endonuclease subunit S [Thermoanaerobaculia bacterium]
MVSEWRRLKLREAGVTLIDCDHRTPQAADEGYPYVAIPQMKAGRLDLKGARKISQQHFFEWRKKAKPIPNDIVLSRRCNPGETALVTADCEFALGQNLVLLRADGERLHRPFLRWLVRGPEWWEQIGKFLNVGAVFDSLRCADVPNFEVSVPPLSEQRAIAHVLGTLDEKIELNRRMNETLEAMARALFKSWFVDFDPVRAKAEGRDPGVPQPLADLFPDSFEDSELSEIPKGWRVGSILEIARLMSGGTPKTDRPEYWNGGIPWASAKDVSQASDLFLVDTERTITRLGVDESATQVLPKFCTAIVARGATTGRMAVFGSPMAMNQTCYGLVSSTATPLALYCHLSHEIDGLVRGAHGSVFDTITTSTFASSKVVLPRTSALEAFERQVEPLFRRLLSNVNESRTLATLRDAQLPKLISGELRIEDTKRILAGANA